MREDMYKVIVERPRRGKYGYSNAKRLRNDWDGPMRLGTRAGYGGRGLNENLAPLRRYLHAQIGRPWNKVYGEICAGIDRRNTVQQHIHQHIDDFIAIHVDVRDGRLIDLGDRRSGFLRFDPGVYQELYVDPRTGLIRLNRDYRSWRRHLADRRRREQTEIASCRRIVDERMVLLLLDGVWYRIEVARLPEAPEPRYDVVRRRNVSRGDKDSEQQSSRLYGSTDLYAVSKRQMATREIKAHQLR